MTAPPTTGSDPRPGGQRRGDLPDHHTHIGGVGARASGARGRPEPAGAALSTSRVSPGLIALTAMAKPMSWAGALPVVLVATAVFIPMTCAWALTRGPPELPGLIGASVRSRPVRFCGLDSSAFSAASDRSLGRNDPLGHGRAPGQGQCVPRWRSRRRPPGRRPTGPG